MRVLCISDTHGYQTHLEINEDVDVIVCTGDFSNSRGARNVYESEEFLGWFDSLKIKYKILIAGNHDTDFERKWEASFEGGESIEDYLKREYPTITYLQDSSVIIDGIKFYGTPWCPLFYDWAFMKRDSELVDIFAQIDDDVQVLLTHTPAYGILDYATPNFCGSEALLNRIKNLKKLKFHVFGHIHECAGQIESVGTEDVERYKAINASTFNCIEIKQPVEFEVFND